MVAGKYPHHNYYMRILDSLLENSHINNLFRLTINTKGESTDELIPLTKGIVLWKTFPFYDVIGVYLQTSGSNAQQELTSILSVGYIAATAFNREIQVFATHLKSEGL